MASERESGDSLKDRLLRAAMTEFAQNGFRDASTNRIVTAAGSSKGVLFYHFRDKRTLFLEAVRDALSVIRTEYLDRVPWDEPDFLERYRLAAQTKLELQLRRPELYQFIGNLYLHYRTDLPEDLLRRMEDMSQEAARKLHAGADLSRCRGDIPPDRLKNMVRWMVDGYTAELMERMRHLDLTQVDMAPYWAEFQIMLKDLKQLIQREDHRNERD